MILRVAAVPSLIEEEVAKTVVNSAIFIKFKSLGLVSSGTNYDVCAKSDEFAEELIWSPADELA